MHDIEVNIWEKKVFDETLVVQEAVNKIIQDSKNNDEVIARSCKYFDSLYNEKSHVHTDFDLLLRQLNIPKLSFRRKPESK